MCSFTSITCRSADAARKQGRYPDIAQDDAGRLFSAVSTKAQGRFTLPVSRHTMTAVLAYR